MLLTFEELRKIKDNLPHGSMETIAHDLNIDVQTVRNYFGGADFTHGSFVGAHYEPGVHGGYVKLDEDRIYEYAVRLIEKHSADDKVHLS
jgi:hypothetical protein